MTLDSFTYSQKLNADLIEDVLINYYKARNKIRADIDPLAEKDAVKAESKRVKDEIKQLKMQGSEQALENEYTFARAFDDYCKDDLYTTDISEPTHISYANCYNKHIHNVIGHIPLTKIKRMDIKRLVDSLTTSRRNIAVSVINKVQAAAIDNEIIEIPFSFNIKMKKVQPRSRLIEDLPAFLTWLQSDGY